MARDKNQTLLFNDNELSLLNNTFADSDDLLFAIRKVLLQFPLSEGEKAMVKGMSPELYAAVKQRVYPELDPDAPFFQLGDLYQGLNPEFKSRGMEEMLPVLEAKGLEIEYLDQQFKALRDLDNAEPPKIVLDRMKIIDKDNLEASYVSNLARNHILSHVDTFLNFIKILAGQKKETPEEIKKRIERDSSK